MIVSLVVRGDRKSKREIVFNGRVVEIKEEVAFGNTKVRSNTWDDRWKKEEEQPTEYYAISQQKTG